MRSVGVSPEERPGVIRISNANRAVVFSFGDRKGKIGEVDRGQTSRRHLGACSPYREPRPLEGATEHLFCCIQREASDEFEGVAWAKATAGMRWNGMDRGLQMSGLTIETQTAQYLAFQAVWRLHNGQIQAFLGAFVIQVVTRCFFVALVENSP